MAFTLTNEEKKILLETARLTLENNLRRSGKPLPGATENLQTKCGAFVTLRKKEKNQLRGCIGHMTGIQPLFEAIQELAVSSATRDPRFPALTSEEVDQVTIEITVLTPLEKISDPDVIEIGRHGIYIQSGRHSGVLLPQVPVEQGWDRETFLRHTCMKAGLGPAAWKDPASTISIFEGIVFSE